MYSTDAHADRHPPPPVTRRSHLDEPTLHVVLDDATVARLREAAARGDVEVEQLLVQIIHAASRRLDDYVADGLPRGP